MPKTAKQKLIDFIVANGWVPDPTETLPKYPSNWNFTREQRAERVQSPYAFMRPTTFGGDWHIHLGYNKNRGTYSRVSDERGNVLQAIHITYQPAEGDRQLLSPVGTLKNVDNLTYGRFNNELLWKTLREFKPNGDSETLTQVAQKLIKDPEIAIWLAIEAWWQRDERERKEREVREALQRERAKPIPVEIPREEWTRRARQLVTTAKAVYGADGVSDLPQLVADAQLALEAVQSALTDEAQQASEAIVGEAHQKLTAQDQEALKDFLQTL